MKLTKIKTKLLHKNPWWQYKHDICVVPNGTYFNYYYGESKGNAMTIPITKDGKIIMIYQYRYLKNKNSLEFPCGWINNKETPRQTAARELEEETCYHSKDIKRIKTFEAVNGCFRNPCHLFIALDASRKINCKPEVRGIIKVLKCSPSQIEKMIETGKIWNGQTLAAWSLARKEAEYTA